MQRDTSLSHRVDQAVDHDLRNAVPVLFKVAEYWREVEHDVVHLRPEHPKHAQWVTCLVSMHAMEELGHFQHPGIVYRSLQHYHAET